MPKYSGIIQLFEIEDVGESLAPFRPPKHRRQQEEVKPSEPDGAIETVRPPPPVRPEGGMQFRNSKATLEQLQSWVASGFYTEEQASLCWAQQQFEKESADYKAKWGEVNFDTEDDDVEIEQ